MDARAFFDQIFGDLKLSENDAVWHVFKAGWNARDKLDRGIDANVDAVREKMKRRAQMGLAKYGVTTERNDLTTLQWLNHAQEEAMDMCVYLERVMLDIKRRNEKQKSGCEHCNNPLFCGTRCKSCGKRFKDLED